MGQIHNGLGYLFKLHKPQLVEQNGDQHGHKRIQKKLYYA